MPPGPMPGPPGYPPYPPPPPNTNGLAIASLVCAFLFFPLGIVFGHMSLSQIRKKREGGHGLAIAGLVISYVAAVLTVLAILFTVVFAAFLVRFADFNPNRSYSGSPNTTGSPLPSLPLPTFKPSATLGSNCQYPATTEPTSKPVNPPRSGKVPTTPATVNATIVTNDGAIGVQLDNGKSPCTVNNFVSLAQQGFFDKTPCHRLTTADSLKVLQCGDPTGTGTGGPGYTVPDENPTDLPGSPAGQGASLYARGTVAMANTGQPHSGGSQFFLVYADSALPPSYAVFGTVSAAGLKVLDKVAAGGVAGSNPQDGAPTVPVTITSATVAG
jgi:peptidyl-prolyl cis-trans isomerase B (cyclophilin B)